MTTPRPNMIRRTAEPSATKQRTPVKIVITGPFSAGKTTLIKTISEVAIVGTERDVTDETKAIKERTTVAMDFGRISFEDDASLFLFGTPGQRRFEVMWEILSDGMIGFILLIHAGDERSLMEGWHILQTFKSYADVPYVIGVTHMDEAQISDDEVFAQVREVLEHPPEVNVYPCDPRQREDVKALMLQILREVQERLERAEAAG